MIDTKDLANYSWNLIQYINDNQGKVLSVSAEVENERKELCTNCEHYEGQEQVCKMCGCFVPQKVKHVFDSCPVNKWGRDKENWIKNFDNLYEEVDKSF